MIDQTVPTNVCEKDPSYLPLTLLLLGIGTGGFCTPDVVKSHMEAEYSYVRYEDQNDLHETGVSSVAISRVKSALNLSIGELAECIGVSRQTIYNWKSGSDVKPVHARKFDNLKSAADVIASAYGALPPLAFARKLSGGKTLLEMISAGRDGADAARDLVQILKHEEEQHQEIDRYFAERGRSRERVTNSAG